MKKVSFLLTASTLVSMMSFSQETKQRIEKLSNDPKTAENAAKADVYILKNKRVIGDTIKPQTCESKLFRTRNRAANDNSECPFVLISVLFSPSTVQSRSHTNEHDRH